MEFVGISSLAETQSQILNQDPLAVKPETVEELLKEENLLLKEILRQNQIVLSRTAEILEQNQKLMELLMKERMNTYLDEESAYNADPLDTGKVQYVAEEDTRDSNRITSEVSDETNLWSVSIATEDENDLLNSFPVKDEVFTEEDVEMENTAVPQPEPGKSKEILKTAELIVPIVKIERLEIPSPEPEDSNIKPEQLINNVLAQQSRMPQDTAQSQIPPLHMIIKPPKESPTLCLPLSIQAIAALEVDLKTPSRPIFREFMRAIKSRRQAINQCSRLHELLTEEAFVKLKLPYDRKQWKDLH